MMENWATCVWVPGNTGSSCMKSRAHTWRLAPPWARCSRQNWVTGVCSSVGSATDTTPGVWRGEERRRRDRRERRRGGRGERGGEREEEGTREVEKSEEGGRRDSIGEKREEAGKGRSNRKG